MYPGPRAYVPEDMDFLRAQAGYFADGFPMRVMLITVWSGAYDALIGRFDHTFKGLYDRAGGFEI